MREKKAKQGREPTRWDPFAELERFPRIADLFRSSEWPEAAGVLRPAVDVVEDDAGYHVTVELAGARKEDVHVEVHDNVLTIQGEKKSEREEKQEHARYIERRFGSFSRSFTLPADARADQVAARLDNGVLTLDIPKSEQTKPRAVHIQG